MQLREQGHGRGDQTPSLHGGRGLTPPPTHLGTAIYTHVHGVLFELALLCEWSFKYLDLGASPFPAPTSGFSAHRASSRPSPGKQHVRDGVRNPCRPGT